MKKAANFLASAVAVAVAAFIVQQAATEALAWVKVPPAPPPPTVVEEGDYYVFSQSWTYDKTKYYYETKIPKRLYQHYRNKVRYPPYDYSVFVEDKEDDAFLSAMASDIGGRETGLRRLGLALSFVQSLKYMSDAESVGRGEYPRYPVETLVDGGGDCEDTSFLFASLARAMGHKVVLLLYTLEEHFAVAVNVPREWLKSWMYVIWVGNEPYVFCETTSTGWEVGEKPGRLLSRPLIILVD